MGKKNEMITREVKNNKDLFLNEKIINLECKHVILEEGIKEKEIMKWSKLVGYKWCLWGTARGFKESNKERSLRETKYILAMALNVENLRPVKIIRTEKGTIWVDNTHTALAYLLFSEKKDITIKEIPFYFIDFVENEIVTNSTDILKNGKNFMTESIRKARRIDEREKKLSKETTWNIGELLGSIDDVLRGYSNNFKIFSDIDGTIIPLGEDRGFTESEKEEMRILGDKLMLITGRPLTAIPESTIHTICSSSNGALVKSHGGIFIKDFMNGDRVKKYLDYLVENCPAVNILITSSSGSHFFNLPKEHLVKSLGLGDVRGDNSLEEAQVFAEGILKITIFGEEEDINLIETLYSLNDFEKINKKESEFAFLRTHPNCVDWNLTSTAKDSVIATYRVLNPNSLSVAIGDGSNDESMLKESDIGIAINTENKNLIKISSFKSQLTWIELMKRINSIMKSLN